MVSTATLALQNQLVDRDLPRLADAVEPLLGRRPTFAILKGRSNYLCKHKVYGGMPDDPDGDGALFDPAPSTTWAGRSRGCATGPTTPRPATATSSTRGRRPGLAAGRVTARECVGAARCPYGAECFAEVARERRPRGRRRGHQPRLLAIDMLEESARAARSTRCSSSTRRTSWPTG